MKAINRREPSGAIHCNCGGKGTYIVEETEPPFCGGFATHLCACRISEQPRDGEARWWTTEDIKEMAFRVEYGFDSMTATIERERPVSADNHRLIRTPENVYYPTMATLEGEFSSVGLMASQLRDLAKWLNEVADEVDRIDSEVS